MIKLTKFNVTKIVKEEKKRRQKVNSDSGGGKEEVADDRRGNNIKIRCIFFSHFRVIFKPLVNNTINVCSCKTQTSKRNTQTQREACYDRR